jgi:hypothetical protein
VSWFFRSMRWWRQLRVRSRRGRSIGAGHGRQMTPGSRPAAWSNGYPWRHSTARTTPISPNTKAFASSTSRSCCPHETGRRRSYSSWSRFGVLPGRPVRSRPRWYAVAELLAEGHQRTHGRSERRRLQRPVVPTVAVQSPALGRRTFPVEPGQRHSCHRNTSS